ncbi:phage regulatory CII family protein [Halomonas sp. B23F22_10]|uniref:phage regulatory CII family protein n=1 Tax=Halomonas sp. B23F22_10 TaxID=3459515 RepID=UPI00373E4AD6
MDKHQGPIMRDMDSFIDPVHDAAFANCIKRMAGNVGMSAKSLYRRLDENDAMPLRFSDAVAIFWTVDEDSRQRILQPFLDDMGLVAIPAAKAREGADLLDLMTDHQVSFGNVASTVRDAIADRKIDARERAEIAQVVQEEIDALCALRAALEGMAEPKLAKA